MTTGVHVKPAILRFKKADIMAIISPITKQAFRIASLALACVAAALWFTVLTGNDRRYIEVPPSVNHRDYIEGRRRTRAHFLLMSDRRGIVFDLFVRQLPPEKAPGPPGSDETQRWLKPRAERAAAAYARHLGFEKGIEHRHGQYLNEPLDNCLAFLPDRGRHSRTQTSQTNPQI